MGLTKTSIIHFKSDILGIDEMLSIYNLLTDEQMPTADCQDLQITLPVQVLAALVPNQQSIRQLERKC